MWTKLAAFLAVAGSTVQAVEPLVDLGHAKYNGVDQGDGVTKWLGVRYGAAPVGDLRFRAPQDPEPSTEVIEADKASHPHKPHRIWITQLTVRSSAPSALRSSPPISP